MHARSRAFTRARARTRARKHARIRTDLRAQLRMNTRGILQVDAGQTVEYVRAYLHEHYGVPFNGSTLQYEGRTLIDPMSLSDFGGIICACVSVYAYVRGRDYIPAL